MVGGGADALLLQPRGEGVAFGAGGGVDDAGDGVGSLAVGGQLGVARGVATAAGVHALQPGDEGGEARVVAVGGEADFVVEIGPGGGGGEGAERFLVQREGVDDVVADARCCGRGEADDGRGGVGGAEVGEVEVGGAEVVTPFGDTCVSISGAVGLQIVEEEEGRSVEHVQCASSMAIRASSPWP